MFDLLFSGNAAWFGIPAVCGSVFFLLRLTLMLVVGGFEAADVDFDAGGDVAADGQSDPGNAVKTLSIQSIAAFMMGFGWGGLAAWHGFDMSWSLSGLIGLGVGVAMVWVLGLLLKGLHDLQSSGNVRTDDAIGIHASVYTRIPPRGQGRGQVRVVIEGRQRIYNAISLNGPIESRSQVRVTNVNDDNTLTVTGI